VSPTHIDPGDYWIIGAWDSEIFIISYEYQPPQPPDWYFWTTAFGPLPDTVPGQMFGIKPAPVLYAYVAQDTQDN
jgi:hypothetical protein